MSLQKFKNYKTKIIKKKKKKKLISISASMPSTSQNTRNWPI